ncbi:hypothetical protein IE81DRAFT_321959 [Ceraceosorus guamensis]|uniref:Coatomer subunit zeta n=1 Tax=Ceraceosorus guamensis TaxID=1522189 RepID=A0A316W6T7_9BASI|nr:hypothetical protein IE81DRAFT_321959 [Ceraceosorus guamensis]PWN43793.1 hypothetical protein IE81DRAFT_321959 [Ceraceosorus guamensis]
MSNLTLYSTTAILLLDASDGSRIVAKYYEPPHAQPQSQSGAPAHATASGLPPQLNAKNNFATLREQKAFEKAVWEKTRRAAGDVILYDSHLVLFRASLDVILYVVGPQGENELMLSSLLSSLYDSIAALLQHGQIDRRAVLENLDLVTLAIDESVDDGIILEMDSMTIASRVSRPRPDVTEMPQINEQTLSNFYSSVKERVAQRILQGGI